MEESLHGFVVYDVQENRVLKLEIRVLICKKLEFSDYKLEF